MFKKKKIESDDAFVHIDEYVEDEDIEAEILEFMNLSDDEDDIEDKNKKKKKEIKIIADNKTKKHPKSFKGFKNKNNMDFVDVGEPVSYQTNFVIVGDNKDKFKDAKKIFKIIFSIILFMFTTLILVGIMLFKVIPGNIVGSNYYFKNFSIISRDYQPNISELDVGDEIICIDKNFDFLPFLSKHESYKFQSKNNNIIFAQDENGNKVKIQSLYINYIIKNTLQE